MARVLIAFDADSRKIGKVREVSEEEAATLVREGRARRLADQSEPAAAEDSRASRPAGKAARS
jgi:hypothetical protein